MARRLSAVGATVALVLTTLVLLPAEAAYAVSGCGSGYYRAGDGYLTKSKRYTGKGSHNGYIYHAGKVRYCTEDDTLNDDENRRALIGYPSDTYSFESEVTKNGTYSSFCVTQKIRAHLTGISSSSKWSISGSLSKKSPGVSATYEKTKKTVTVTANLAGNKICGSNKRLIARIGGIVVTAENESGKVDWVELTTTITAKYTVDGTKYSDKLVLAEKDYS